MKHFRLLKIQKKFRNIREIRSLSSLNSEVLKLALLISVGVEPPNIRGKSGLFSIIGHLIIGWRSETIL